jgi:hypothetical protein
MVSNAGKPPFFLLNNFCQKWQKNKNNIIVFIYFVIAKIAFYEKKIIMLLYVCAIVHSTLSGFTIHTMYSSFYTKLTEAQLGSLHQIIIINNEWIHLQILILIWLSSTVLHFWTSRSKEIYLEYDPSTPTFSRRNWSCPDKDLIRSRSEKKGDLKNQSFPLHSYPNFQKLVYFF